MVELTQVQRYLIEEFAEDYQSGELERREMLRRVVLITGSITAAATVLTTLGCTPSASPTTAAPAVPPVPTGQAAAPVRPVATATPVVGPDATVAANDPAVQARDVTLTGPAGTIFGYLARPAETGSYPGMIVISDNQGLDAVCEENTRRIAKLGFIALAPDLTSRAGGTKALADRARIAAAFGQTPADDLTADLIAGVAYLKNQPGVLASKIGVFGFCVGGNFSYRLAVASPDIVAATPFYGPPPPLDQVPNLRGTVWAVYAGNDARVNASIPDLDAAMKSAGKNFSYEVFPDTAHGFHRSTDNPVHMAQAKLAWQKMVDFMTKQLKA